MQWQERMKDWRFRVAGLSLPALPTLALGAAWLGIRMVNRDQSAATRNDYKLIGNPLPGTEEFSRAIEATAHANTSEGNTLQVLRNGDEIFPSMLQAIREAKYTINLLTYVYWTGPIAQEVAAALSERAEAGVKCNVLLDAFGCNKISKKLIQDMKEAGVRVEWFRPLALFDVNRLDNRTHRKVLVVDGRVGFTGGVGIASEWMGNAQDKNHWRDTHIRVEGPAVLALQGAFGDNWFEATGETLAGEEYLPALTRMEGGLRLQVTRSSASKYDTNMEALFQLAIAASTKSLWITMAYFVPTRAFTRNLIELAKKGVDIRILVAGHRSNHKLVLWAGRDYYDELLKNRIRIFEFEPTMLHAKTMLVDGIWGTVGSTNFDNRSFSLNDEINVSFQDRDLAAILESHFLEDVSRAKEITLEQWDKRGPIERTLNRASTIMNMEL
ncbi:MAG: cardiolipin synthase B [Chloroflexi bacterium]|nr:cardiolipin synthase B [Chloroflexota bacterium]